ncbi:CHOLINE PHOSPHATE CYTIDYLYLTRANSFERASE [Encephalitozoon cuniculi GB-M1]|uniref:choline-phosphate cytidylyltransferase n=2 Tax=Encephalitozoon cuniculi TaxID=6035 RepID=Q8SR03_ENCCU|nr:choline-phosphate cytidylyltransferase [Encephalitozoon cuniculi GB-M1]AGE96166.1 choline phosphate cytidylyltransferase [Encephalitozoon cuniculi]KMV65313.1 choline-phosphate cytidylyltransferase [Encephalitozoon cuniculi EcunIII-L]UYI26625.1 choline-phosphate cytidylyltransferase [Encephalitozoon cuniculi]CAD25880.1 CHOLINE PHOSPHATE CYTIDYLYLTRANSFERASE [Encephalitozoon cuniculi GB-M1]
MKKDDASEEYRMMMPSYPDRNAFEYEDMTTDVGMYRVPVNRPVRIYCDGVYDLFHYGHARSLKQAKNLFPNVYLLVGVTDDDITVRLKGNLVMDENERAEGLIHCRYVDEVITSAPWELTLEFLQKHKIDFVAHDDIPYKGEDKDDIYKFVKDMGMFIPIRRTKGISTSGIITSIVKNYDMYVRRNLERGVSAKDLNISFLQMKRIKMSKKMNEMIKNVDIQREIDDIRREIRIAMRYWERVSNEIISGFIENFYHGKSSNRFIDRLVGLVKLKKENA